jgi:hypothetical protein
VVVVMFVFLQSWRATLIPYDLVYPYYHHFPNFTTPSFNTHPLILITFIIHSHFHTILLSLLLFLTNILFIILLFPFSHPPVSPPPPSPTPLILLTPYLILTSSTLLSTPLPPYNPSPF